MRLHRAMKGLIVSLLLMITASTVWAGSFAPIGSSITYDAGFRCAVPFWALSDLNRDGRSDVVLAMTPSTTFTSASEPGELTIWTGQSDGTLLEQTRQLFTGSVTAAYNFSQVRVGDLNGDGVPDIFVPDGGVDTYVNGIPVGPWLGSTPKIAMSTGASWVDNSSALSALPSVFAHTAALSDLNRDGSLDAYVGSISAGTDKTPYLLMNDGRGNFVRNQSRLPTSVTVSGSTPWVTQSDGSLLGSGQQFTGSIFLDYNNDGAPDLILLAANSTPYGLVLTNDGTGDFSRISPINLPAGLYGAGKTKLKNNPDGSATFTQGSGTVSLDAVAVDLNNDGYLDLAIVQTIVDEAQGIYYRGGKLQILINQHGSGFVDETASRGAPGFDTTVNYDSYHGTLSFFDINGDGFQDLIAVRVMGGAYESHIFLNDGYGRFQRSSIAGLPTQGFIVPLSVRQGEPVRVASFNIENTGWVQTPGGQVGACNLIEQVYLSNIQVIEFYNTNLDNYFITTDAGEAAAIDNGSAGPGWSRTGNTFKSGGSTSVCRFYGSYSPGPNSHFYTVDASECQGLKDQQIPASDPRKLTVKNWNFESLDFISTPPTTAGINGTCPTGATPVYRAYNNGNIRGVDSNHRITSSLTAIQEVVSRGWSNEGVVMCAPN